MNAFDQFDEGQTTQQPQPGTTTSGTGGNYFDQFDTPPAPEAGSTGGILDRALAVASDVGKFVTTPSEISKAVVHGTANAFNEGMKSVQSAGDWLDNHVYDTKGITPKALAIQTPQVDQGTVDAVEPTTGTGKFLSGAVQFIEGMAGVGKITKTLGLAKGLAAAGQTADTAAKSALTMATFFDPYQERLSNMIQENPTLANPVAAFLASNKDDNEAVARLKNGLEGAGVSAGLEGLFHGIVAIKNWKDGNIDGAVSAAEQAGKAAQAVSPEDVSTKPGKVPGDATVPTEGDVPKGDGLLRVRIKPSPQPPHRSLLHPL